MLTSTAKTTGGFEYAGEYYTLCCAFLSGTDPSMPSKALLQPNDLNIDRLLKVTGCSSKMHIEDATNHNPPHTVEGEKAHATQWQEFLKFAWQ